MTRVQTTFKLGNIESSPGLLPPNLLPDIDFAGVVSSTVVTIRWQPHPDVSITPRA